MNGGDVKEYEIATIVSTRNKSSKPYLVAMLAQLNSARAE